MIDTFLVIYLIFSRLFELFLSKKNTKKLLQNGGTELYKFHYKFIVFFHIIFITFFLVKSFSNTFFIIEYLYLFLLVQIIRYKIIYDLGKFWTTRIVVINKPLVKTWMFKYFRHPNYLVVFVEIIIICLFFNDFFSLVFFSIFNAALLGVRIFYEEKANKFRRN